MKTYSSKLNNFAKPASLCSQADAQNPIKWLYSIPLAIPPAPVRITKALYSLNSKCSWTNPASSTFSAPCRDMTALPRGGTWRASLPGSSGRGACISVETRTGISCWDWISTCFRWMSIPTGRFLFPTPSRFRAFWKEAAVLSGGSFRRTSNRLRKKTGSRWNSVYRVIGGYWSRKESTGNSSYPAACSLLLPAV